MRSQKPSTLHGHLHLQHHHHTGKVLHHRHTSYRGLAVVLVLSGIFIIGLNALSRATADSIYVTARNPAPIPTTPATITNFGPRTIVHRSSLTITGMCPVIDPRVIVSIIDNDAHAGSAACDTSNEYSVPITLQYGDHTIFARTYTITDDVGPDSSPIYISYPAPTQPPATTSPSPVTTTGPNASNTPGPSGENTTGALKLISARPFMIYGPSKDALWIGHISGGAPPYNLQIDWGDGRKEKHVVNDSAKQYLRHHYRTVHAYDVNFTVTDSAGQRLVWHTAAVSPYTPRVSPILSTGGSGSFGRLQWIGIYGVYLMLLALFGYLWARSHPYVYAKVPARIPVTGAKRKRKRQ